MIKWKSSTPYKAGKGETGKLENWDVDFHHSLISQFPNELHE
jgi:hypothetical protein